MSKDATPQQARKNLNQGKAVHTGGAWVEEAVVRNLRTTATQPRQKKTATCQFCLQVRHGIRARPATTPHITAVVVASLAKARRWMNRQGMLDSCLAEAVLKIKGGRDASE